VTDWFLDSCSLLNLFASGQLERIATDLDLRFHVIPKVYPDESRFIVARAGLIRTHQVPVNLERAIEAGLVICAPDLNDAEKVFFIQYAAVVDDGEAATFAAAVSRGLGVITDDRGARKKFDLLAPQVIKFTSVGLVRQWVEAQNIDNDTAQEVLVNIQICGGYTIGRNEPEIAWCQSIL
jgi:predicted nucleic acid-binding protein